MADSTQHKIGRNRSPRVQITYDVEIGNAIEKQEIPFVVGIMADLSGAGDKGIDRPPLKDASRSFVEIDRDNFGDVMAKLVPRIEGISGALDLEDKETDGGVLSFHSMDDFGPTSLVKRVKGLKELQDKRAALRDLLTKLDSNDALYREVKERVEKKTMKALGDAAAGRLVETDDKKEK